MYDSQWRSLRRSDCFGTVELDGKAEPIQQALNFDRLTAAVERLAEQRTHASAPMATKALDRDEAAQYLGIAPNKLDYLVRVRRIRFVKLGDQKGRVFRTEDLDQFLENNTQMTADEMLRKKRPR